MGGDGSTVVSLADLIALYEDKKKGIPDLEPEDFLVKFQSGEPLYAIEEDGKRQANRAQRKLYAERKAFLQLLPKGYLIGQMNYDRRHTNHIFKDDSKPDPQLPICGEEYVYLYKTQAKYLHEYPICENCKAVLLGPPKGDLSPVISPT